MAAAASHSPSYQAALGWLFGTQRFGIKLGLENIERLLRALNVPAARQRVVHVAGTNGKGSVCAMIASVARAQGYRTGLFTSPHLVTFRERMQVNGAMIGEAEVTAGLERIRQIIEAWDPHPTFFEIATALALLYFTEEQCDIVVLETGMGGRLDATNAVTPVVSVITPVDYDHQKWLGHTLGEIAMEKAGIIKPSVPVVAAAQREEAAAVLRAKAAQVSAPLEFITTPYRTSPIALPGQHQQLNASLALAALRVAGIECAQRAIQAGLADVSWPARFEIWNDRIVIDGAHNPAGARVAIETWRQMFSDEKATLVFGVLRDKDIAAVFRALAPVADSVVLPRFRGERVVPPEEVAEIIAAASPQMRTQTAGSPAEALEVAQRTSHRIFVAGSLHLAGEVLAHLRGSPSAFEQCAQ